MDGTRGQATDHEQRGDAGDHAALRQRTASGAGASCLIGSLLH